LSTAESDLENGVRRIRNWEQARISDPTTRPALGVADHAFDGRKRAAQRALHRIDVLVTLITLIDGAARQWKLTISPASVLQDPHAVDVIRSRLRGEARQRRS